MDDVPSNLPVLHENASSYCVQSMMEQTQCIGLGLPMRILPQKIFIVALKATTFVFVCRIIKQKKEKGATEMDEALLKRLEVYIRENYTELLQGYFQISTGSPKQNQKAAL